MSLQKLPDQQIHPVCQTTLAFLEREDVNVPANMIESIVSVKSMFRAILGGQLHLCTMAADPAPPEGAELPVKEPEAEPEAETKSGKKAA